MRKRAKLTYLIYLVLVLALASNASAVDKEWTGAGDPNRWDVAANWNPAIVPLVGETVEINIPDVNCLIDSAVTAVCSELTVAENQGIASICYLDMTGGSLYTNANVIVGHDPNANGVFNMSDGDVNCNRLWVGYGSDTVGKPAARGNLNISDGNVFVRNKLELGKNLTGVGTINMSGGTINILSGDKDFEIGLRGEGSLYMTGGDVNVVDALKMAGDSTGTALIAMNGGTLLTNDLRMNDSGEGTSTINLVAGEVNCVDLKMYMGDVKPIIDINEGTLIVQADEWLDDITDKYIPNGWIIGYHGEGRVIVTPSGGGIGYTTVTAEPADPNLAWNPTPKHYATVQWTPAGVTLTWEAAQTGNADNHDVYFGTDWDDVNDANNLDPSGPSEIYKGNQDPCSYGPLSLVLDQTYYWRIDENDTGVKVYKGDVWQFRTAEVVEDFDSYAADVNLEAVWHLTGSDIDINDTIVHTRPGKSMRYDYNNAAPSPYYTEAYANTTGPNSLPIDINDWTKADIKALTLYFYGNENNAAEEMYVALKDTNSDLAIVYYEDPNDLNEPEWHEWNIKMSDFDTNDFDSNDVNNVYIGFGNRENPVAGGNGTVYFDDIRLYPRRCVPVYGPNADIGGPYNTEYDPVYDCRVDNVDVNIMAGEWLKADYNGVGKDGVLNNFTSPGCWVAGEKDNALLFDGTDDWVDLDDTGFSDFHNKTISFWVKVLEYPTVYRYLFYFSDQAEKDPYRIYFMTYTVEETSYHVRVRFLNDYSVKFNLGLDSWCHLAFVLRDTDEGCTGEFYAEGYLVGDEDDKMTGRPRHSGRAYGVNMGSANDGASGFVNAAFDDFRVYDYALSAGEVEYLAGEDSIDPQEPNDNLLLYHYKFDETSGLIADNNSPLVFYHPLFSFAELYDGEAEGLRKINLRDFSVLANDWLKEQLWP